jgi:hypothetical protein
MVRQQNTMIDEPKDFGDLTRTLESQQMKELERQRKLEEIRLQLEETRQALLEARSKSNGETEELKKAEEAIEVAKQFEAELQVEGVKEDLQSKNVLYGINELSPSSHIARTNLIDFTYKLAQRELYPQWCPRWRMLMASLKLQTLTKQNSKP